MSLNPEATVPCPYNMAHMIVLSRMQFHLQKCRAQHPQAEKVICPFNTTHIVNKVELEWHLEWCSSRITGEREFFRIGSKPVRNNTLPIDEKVPTVTGNEVWNEEEACGESVLEKVREVCKIKPALTNKICSTKSVRKQHKLDERRRFISCLESGEKNGNEILEDICAIGKAQSEFGDQARKISSRGIEVGMSEIRLHTSGPQRTAPKNPANPWENHAAQQTSLDFHNLPCSGRGRRLLQQMNITN